METAAFIAEVPGLSASERERLLAWGQKRFHRFRCRDGLAGGLFKRAPRSLNALQQLLGKNLANWGIERENVGNRGWLRLCFKAEFQERLMGKEIAERWRRLAAAALDKAIKREVRQANTRRRVIKAKIKQAKTRRVAEAFAALAAGVQQRNEEIEARRSAKTALFNEQRFGHLSPRVTYSEEELDNCSSWQEVQCRRKDFPQPAWKNREDEREVQIAREREVSQRAVALAAALLNL